MPSVSSLLKSAQATRNKIRSQEDAFAAFDWESSAQTYDDYMEYSKYLEGRATSTTDASDQLTYQGKLRSARRSFISNELQREQIRIMEGRGTTQDKMQAVQQLYMSAVENGDLNTAQNLISQWDTLSIKFQNEQEAAMRATERSNRSMATNSAKSLKQLVDTILTKGTDGLEINGKIVKPLNLLSEELKASGTSGVGNPFVEAQATIDALQQVIIDAYNSASSQEAADDIEEKYGGYIDGTKKFKVLGMDMTIQDVALAAQSDAANNPLYTIASKRNELTGENEYSLNKNRVESFVWARTGQDAEGQDIYEPVNVRTTQVGIPNQDLSTRFNDEGYVIGEGDRENQGIIGTGEQVSSDASMSVQNRLTQLGIETGKANEDGTVNIYLPDQGWTQATIMPDGTIRYYGPPGQYSGGTAGLYEISLFDRPEFGLMGPIAAGQPREIAPDESSIFGTTSKFGGMLSQASQSGKNVLNAYQGRDQNSGALLGPAARINSSANNFTGEGFAVKGSNLQGTTTSVLQQAATIQKQKEIELQAQQRAMQATPTFNLNQTPVQQFAQNGAPVRQLTVAKPLVAPRVQVAAPTPNSMIRSVGVARPTGRVTVAAPRAQPRVVVR